MIFENGLNFVVRYEYSRKMRPSKSNKKKTAEKKPTEQAAKLYGVNAIPAA